MRVALTGATGFTGRRVVEGAAAPWPSKCTALVRPPVAGTDPHLKITIGRRATWPRAAALSRLLQGRGRVRPRGVARLRAPGGAWWTPSRRPACAGRSSSPPPRSSPGSPPPRRPRASRPRIACGRSGERWTILRPTMIYGDAGDRNLSRLDSLRRALAPFYPFPAAGALWFSRCTSTTSAGPPWTLSSARAPPGREYNLPGAEAAPCAIGPPRGHGCSGGDCPPDPADRPMAASRGCGLARPASTGLRRAVPRLAEDKASSFEDAQPRLGLRAPRLSEGLTDEVRRLREAGWI